MNKPKSKTILFVCTGNTCRSPMAETLLKAALKKQKLRGFLVKSAGISAKKGDTMNPKSAEVLAENGLARENFTSKKLTGKMLVDAFAVISMTGAQRDYLLDMRWHALKKAGLIDDEVENNVYSFAELTGYEVLDPYGKDLDCYRYVYGLIEAGVSALIENLRLKDYALPPTPRKPRTKKM